MTNRPVSLQTSNKQALKPFGRARIWPALISFTPVLFSIKSWMCFIEFFPSECTVPSNFPTQTRSSFIKVTEVSSAYKVQTTRNTCSHSNNLTSADFNNINRKKYRYFETFLQKSSCPWKIRVNQ